MTDEATPGSFLGNPLMEEAALWFARMRGPEAECHSRDFEAWLAGGALHRSAYNRVGEIYSIGKFLEGDKQVSDNLPAVVATQGEERNRSRSRLSTLIPVMVCLLLVLGFGLMTRRSQHWSDTDRTIATSSGSESSLRLSTGTAGSTEKLADGSTVTLQPRTVLLIAFDARGRNLTLTQGGARFDVAHESRPFVVWAGGGSITAKGTLFDVSVGTGRQIRVSLLRGRIDVAPPSPNRQGDSVSHLRAGEAMSYTGSPAGLTARPPAPLPDPLDTGASGIREYDNLRLDQLLAQANALNAIKIRLVSAELRSKTVSGRFELREPRKLAERLAWIFDARVEQEPGGDLSLTRH
jgi:transmembrane sensor